MKFNLYAHKETDEGARWNAEDIIYRGVDIDPDVLESYLLTNPLYEVEFDIEYNPATQKFDVVACRTSGWELTR